LDVLAGAQGLDGLLRVHLSGRRQNDGVDVGERRTSSNSVLAMGAP